MGMPAGSPASVATRHSPCDSPAVSNRNIGGRSFIVAEPGKPPLAKFCEVLCPAVYAFAPANFNKPDLKTRRLGDRLASTSSCRPTREAHLHFSSPILGYPSALSAADPPGNSASANVSHVPQIESWR